MTTRKDWATLDIPMMVPINGRERTLPDFERLG
jgi:hypothetical protein